MIRDRTGPTALLLVHGAFHGAWCWERLISALFDRDVVARAVELPFTSLDDDIQTVTHAIERSETPLAVVAHSGGGVPVTYGAHHAQRLIYIAAVMPDPDDEFDLAATPGMKAVRIGDDGTMSLDPDEAIKALYNHCSTETAQWAISRCRPMPSARTSRPHVQSVAWRSVPSTYVICAEDRAVDPVDQRRMAAKAGRQIELNSDHSPFLSHVEPLADFLVETCRN